ncbi:dehydrogenase E1 component subunit alpha/beta [Flagellimonas sp. HMM57]|uniref:alpha-ketoacid dehydrogenase subunit alpha/beta n=1 Tax=unclassified Flagellimonas TaxID=2644544 RepID=UPI0013D8B56B|nr:MULTISPECIES: dehydrogenase E1 component subunit alpha/beta [unclassified Flagellimonas]UII75781.1 dehydrogenase E1 component subunit alpha/beta [Flagellimonas sp. HMM57]
MRYHIGDLDQQKLLDLYAAMLKPRMIEEKMLILLRQGKISKWFSGIGQEAISVGVTHALKSEEYILPMHRNLGVFTSRGIPLNRLFSQWQGKQNGFTQGRDRSFHFGTQEYKIVGMISHLGPQLGVADGIALADMLRRKKRVTAVFTGEGATSEGDFHEALNVASVWNLPVLFCIENNGYGLSTPTKEQYNCENLADRAKGYGMESRIIDGNNILEVYSKIDELCKAIRKRPRPILVEFQTFRMRGHEEASGTKYVPDKLMKKWAKKDPIANYEAFLLEEQLISAEEIEVLKSKITKEINSNLQLAFDEPPVECIQTKELNEVYEDFEYQHIESNSEVKNIRLVDAISQGLEQSMEKYNELIILGQDIADYGGVFKITEGFTKKFGKSRVRNTPICESVIVSAAMGLSINGMKAVMEMQFADFVSSGFNPIVNYLAKVHYRWGEKADVVIRMPCGGGVGAGPFHSQTNEAWFTKTPGLKVVYPSSPYDAKGLLITAINDPNPVLFFEHKGLYRSVYGDVPTAYYTLPFGKANLITEGDMISIVTYGAAVKWATDFLDKNKEIHADVIDLRTLQPLDIETVYTSVKKTGKLLILQEDTLFGGISSDISAMVTENCFEYLDAPIKRVGSLETPIPFAKGLEENYLPQKRFEEALKEILDY